MKQWALDISGVVGVLVALYGTYRIEPWAAIVLAGMLGTTVCCLLTIRG